MADLIDDAGVRHAAAPADARIVSLVPSITELLFDLGLASRLVGRTAYCVHPKGGVRRVKIVGGTKTVKIEKLFSVAPTHVVVNIDETPKALAEAIARRGAAVIVTHPIEVDDNLALYRLIGGVFGADEAAERLCARFTAAKRRLEEAALGLDERRVLYLIWKAPWMTVAPDTYISRTLALARRTTLALPAATRYPELALGEALLADVDEVLFSSEPYPFAAADVEAFGVAFPAHAAKARLIDAEMVSWYGSRAILGLDYLARFAAAAP